MPSNASEWMNAPVRPVVTLMFAGALVYGFITGVVSSDAFLGVSGLVIGFWFKQREDEKQAVLDARSEGGIR